MMDGDETASGPVVKRRFFQPSKLGSPLTKDAAKRQGQITSLAFALLGGREPALAFLNGGNAALGGRPLDLAMASAQGYHLVEQAIHLSAASQTGDGK